MRVSFEGLGELLEHWL
jgi:hypothetical protein